MGQMSQLLSAATLDSASAHYGADQEDRGADRHHNSLVDLVLGNTVAEGLPPSEEGQSVVSILHVLDLRKAGNVGIGHGYEFRERYEFCHDLKPLPHFAVVPAHATMKAKPCRSSGNSDCYTFVNEHGFQIANSLRQASSQARPANAGTGSPSVTVPAPIQARPS